VVDMIVKTEGPISVACFEQASGTVTYNLTDHIDGRRYRVNLLRRSNVSEGTTTRFLLRNRVGSQVHFQVWMLANVNEDYPFELPMGYEFETEFEVVVIGKFSGSLFFEKVN
jgi:hypothetical protein